MPGHGGAYTSEAFTATSTTGADTIDCSNSKKLAIQISSTAAAAGNIDILQSFEGGQGQFVAFLANIPVIDGTTLLAPASDGPFGTLQIDATDVSGGSVTVKIVGFLD
jgi:hypothetical protein